jgi:hypothetical protein
MRYVRYASLGPSRRRSRHSCASATAIRKPTSAWIGKPTRKSGGTSAEKKTTPARKKRVSRRGAIQPRRTAFRASTVKLKRNIATKSRNWSAKV